MKEIIEITISSIDHLEESHIISCADQHMFGNYNYFIKGKIKIRNFNDGNGFYNNNGKFVTVKAFRKKLDNLQQACYDEIIEAQITLVKN